MAATLMVLGGFRFAVTDRTAYSRAVERLRWRWDGQPRIGRGTALQYLGPGDRTLDLEGVIYPRTGAEVRSMDRLAELAGTGRPQDLVDGAGNNLGRWAILAIDRTGDAHLGGGAPRKIEFTVRLQRYLEELGAQG